MQHHWPSRLAALAIVGCLAQASSLAATVGRAQGAVVIGRPLDVSVPVLLEGSTDNVPECSQAEVFYGDTRLPAGSVSTEMQRGASGPVIRVRAGGAINEPVVTVYLQLGCGSKFTRRLVLLAEPDPAVDVQRQLPGVAPAARASATAATESGAPLTLPMRSDVPALAAPAPKPAQPARSKRATPPGTGGKAASAPAHAAATPTKQAASSPTPEQPAPSAGAPRDRLKLDVPVGPAEPAAPSDEAIRQAARLQAIERDLRDMRQFLQRSDAAMLRLQAQLAKAESERYANPLVYLLAALLVVMAGCMAYLWRRAAVARDGVAADWWRAPGDERPASLPALAAARAREGSPRKDRAVAPAAVAAVTPRAEEDQATDSAVPASPRSPLPTARTDDFQSSHGTRALKAEELHDVQQEADFFSSLGEYDRAIDVLRGHIQAHPETSAVAWLDLVEIYHKLGRREEFDWVRREFQHRFNAEVPAFDEYSQESDGIEAYGNAMARIAALWPSRRVLDVIEESIFRGPSKDGTQAFSLQAYRELLLLHHIGQQVLVGSATPPSVFGQSGPGSTPHGFSHTSIHPLSTGLGTLDQQPVTHAVDSQPVTQVADAQPDFVLELDLDLNLDEPAPTQHAAPREEHLLDFDLPDLRFADGSNPGTPRR